MAAGSAFLELGIAPLLFWRRSRRWGIYLALHSIILLLVGPLGMNHFQCVWAWNVGMAAWVAVLFRNFDEPTRLFAGPRRDAGHRGPSLWPAADT